MQKQTFWYEIYTGRKINKEAFLRYFDTNGGDETWYIYYIESDDGSHYELHAHIDGDTVTSAKPFKADVFGGHGRPTINEKSLTSAEKKYAIEVFDECFIDRVGEQLSLTVEHAISSQASFAGYTAIKAGKDHVLFVSPDGAKIKLQFKVLLRALDYSHLDLAVLHDLEVAKELAECLGLRIFEPLFAILQTVDPTRYPEYTDLVRKYRYEQMMRAVASRSIDACQDFVDVLSDPKNNATELCAIAVRQDNEPLLRWLIQNIAGAQCDLCSIISSAIRLHKEDLFNYLVNSGLYDAASSDSTEWGSPVYTAANAVSPWKYILPLLEHGFMLPAKVAYKFYASCSPQELLGLLNYNITLDQNTIDRIYTENCEDIICKLEEKPLRYCDEAMLFHAYVHCGDYRKFAAWLADGYKNNSYELFAKAYKHSQQWTDLWLQYGFDVNCNSARLLHDACRQLDVDFAIYLMKNGADPKLREQYSQTVFEKAAGFHGYMSPDQEADKQRLCKYLLGIGLDLIEESERSPSILSYLMGRSEEFDFFLIDWLADHNYINKPDMSEKADGLKHLPVGHVFDSVGQKYNPRVLRYFIERGACLNAQGITDERLFSEACKVCDLAELQLVVSAGANIYEKDRYGNNALYLSVLYSRPEDIIRYLVSLGLDVNDMRPARPRCSSSSETVSELSVLDVAKQHCGEDVVAFLRAHGAKTAAELRCDDVEDASIGSMDCDIQNGVLKRCKVEDRHTAVLPDGITSIARAAFFYSNIELVRIPEGVTTIEREAFIKCNYLRRIEIPSTLTSFPFDDHDSFPSLQAFVVAKENPELTSVNGVLFSKDRSVLIRVPALLDNTQYTVPDSVTSIAQSAFSGCQRIEEIILPDHPIHFEAMCFSDCKNLKRINLPDSVEKIPYGMFLSSGIEEIRLPRTLKTIQVSAFRSSKLKKIELPSSLLEIGSYAFSPCDLKDIRIPESLNTPIHASAFSQCEVRYSVRFPAGSYVNFETDYTFLEQFSKFYLECNDFNNDDFYIQAVEKKCVLKRHLIHIAITRLFVQSDGSGDNAREFYNGIIRGNKKKAIVMLAKAQNAEYLQILLDKRYISKKDLNTVIESSMEPNIVHFLQSIGNAQ